MIHDCLSCGDYDNNYYLRFDDRTNHLRNHYRMKITIETIPHLDHRYSTCGDWQFDDEGNLSIHVSDMGDVESEVAVAIHEIREALLCRYTGITEQQVCQFDIQFEKERADGLHSLHAEPGDDERAPYYFQHQAATFAERAFIAAGHLAWEEHCKNVEKLD